MADYNIAFAMMAGGFLCFTGLLLKDFIEKGDMISYQKRRGPIAFTQGHKKPPSIWGGNLRLEIILGLQCRNAYLGLEKKEPTLS